MTNAIKLEVGQWVELNNGERHEVTSRAGQTFCIYGLRYEKCGLIIHGYSDHPRNVARILPHMKLPNGDVLFEGDWADQATGVMVGPLSCLGTSPYPWSTPTKGWWGNKGNHQISVGLNLIARANPPQGEPKFATISTKDGPKLWRDMTDAEKGALLLAHHEGKVIESLHPMEPSWRIVPPMWKPSTAYRIKPEPVEPKRETVVIYGSDDGYGWEFDEVAGEGLTCIKLPLINSKMPTGTFTNQDGETIVVEELE